MSGLEQRSRNAGHGQTQPTVTVLSSLLAVEDELGYIPKEALEAVIEAVGGEVVDFPGKTLCCGFPILTINPENSVNMVANHTIDAKDRGAAAMVTPCPLCHLNLDGYQPNASSARKREIDLPIIHLPQLVGLSLGIEPEKMRLNKHIVSTKKLLSELAVTP